MVFMLFFLFMLFFTELSLQASELSQHNSHHRHTIERSAFAANKPISTIYYHPVNNKLKGMRYFVLSIDHDANRQKTLYFNSVDTSKNSCALSSQSHPSKLIKVNNVMVRFTALCKKSFVGETYYHYRVKSQSGLNYLVEQLKKKKTVTFDYDGLKLTFDAQGFQSSWRNYR
ncbi:hypothetical protein L0B53_00520 [Vibrio sp. SS-MA-C1-2]|uniref:hypothetical protein n=1 Tax=Vibrio sp. SS-MA-C1-2 TaxID=2908646 RepID=UPI001F2924A1|nr:hypothetical protein [Vibrio sp. SS-MA-C1-2]UJF17295.1 hypothetical protein L0B53_00520 [Vibrio sp. SS-MA-C1-2]